MLAALKESLEEKAELHFVVEVLLQKEETP